MVLNVMSSSKKPSCKPSFASGIVKAKSSVLLIKGILIFPTMEDCVIKLSSIFRSVVNSVLKLLKEIS